MHTATHSARAAQREEAPWSSARAMTAVVIASLCFATSGPLARMAAPASPLLIAAARTSIAGGALLLLSLGPTLSALRASSLGTLARTFGVGALLAAHFGCFLGGLASTSLPAAVTLVSLEPVTVVMTAWLVFGTRPSRGEGAGIALATLGALVLVAGADNASGEHKLIGDLLVLAAVVLYGLYLAGAKALAPRLSPGAYATLVFLSASVTLWLAMWLSDSRALGPVMRSLPMSSWGAIVALGVIPTLGGHTLVQWAARRVRPSVVALVSPGETIGALLISAAALGEVPRGGEWLGAALALGGVVTTLRAQRSEALVLEQQARGSS